MGHYSQVCPHCLAEGGYLRDAWDLSHVTVCVKHRVRLVDACPSCSVPLRLGRPIILACQRCGYDLRRVPTVSASESECTLTEWSVARAPFRLQYEGRSSVESAETLYGLHTLFWSTDEELLTGRKRHSLPKVAQRHKATVTLARGIEKDALSGGALHYFLLWRVPHIEFLLGTRQATRRILGILDVRESLPPNVKKVLAGCALNEQESVAQSVFAGRPPQIFSADGARAFLGIRAASFEALVANGMCAVPTNGEGFDIDELVKLDEWLDAHLLLQEVDAILGLPRLTQALVQLNVIATAKVPAEVAGFIHLNTLVSMLDRLYVQFGDGVGVACNKGFPEISVAVPFDSRILAPLIADALRGAFATLAWFPQNGLDGFRLSLREFDDFAMRWEATDDWPHNLVRGRLNPAT